MASRTQLVCLCEGAKGTSIDEVFINKLIRTIGPGWVRKQGSNYLRIEPQGGRSGIIQKMPEELRRCLGRGADTTLMVWADCDDDCADPNALKDLFWQEAQHKGITQAEFDQVVFIFAKDRIENWIEFLKTGSTDESKEGPRINNNREAAEAAKKLAAMCMTGGAVKNMPPSLRWSCGNWQRLRDRMK